MATIRNLLSDSRGWLAAASLWNSLSALVCAVFLAPLILAAYLLVRCDGGPALVSCAFLRRDGTAVRTWRFRTVRLHHGNRDDRGTWKRGQPQATAVGGFLRRTRADTLPMLFNVVKGECSMSEMMQDS